MKWTSIFVALLANTAGLWRVHGQNSCEEGSVRAYVANEDAVEYGATDDGQCVDFCFAESALMFVPKVRKNSCPGRGFDTLVSSGITVQLANSPFPLTVDIYNKTNENSQGIYTGSDVDPSLKFEGPCIDCPEYVSLNAKEKLDRIWSKIAEYEYDQLPTNWLHSRANAITADSLPKGERVNVNMIFDRVSDERPPNFPRILHEYGSIAQVEFMPSSVGHKFTGFYGEGSDMGIIRVTFCAPFDGARLNQRVPFAFAAKFLRDGIHSSNILTCEGFNEEFTRDPSFFSVFQHPLHTSTPIAPPTDEFFSLAQNQTGTLSVADNTWFWKNGTSVVDPITPLIVHYFPNEALNTKDEYDEDFRKELLEIPADSVLYTAYTAVDDEGNPDMCFCHETDEGSVPCYSWDSLNAKCNLVELGTLVSRSKFIHSDYGDNGILFKHYRACQEKRKFCEYDAIIPYEDSIFSQSSNRNGMCVSQRRVPNYECPATIEDGNGGISYLTNTRSYCSSEGEYEKEKLCPFAKMLHPAFSSKGSPYPIPPDDHFMKCTALESPMEVATRTTQNSLVQIKCCKAIENYVDADIDTTNSLQYLCNDIECRGSFETAFGFDLHEECASVDTLSSCTFDLQAGPVTLPMDLGFITNNCCDAAIAHSDATKESQIRAEALQSICMEGESCMAAYQPLFAQGQVFTNLSSTETLAETCSSNETKGSNPPFVGTEMEDASKEVDDSSALDALKNGHFAKATFLASLCLGIFWTA